MDQPQTPCSSDPELWFSDRKKDKVLAKELCLTCPLLVTCRERGKSEEYGIWGGEEATGPDKEAERAARIAACKALKDEGLNPAEIGRRLGLARSSVVVALSRAA